MFQGFNCVVLWTLTTFFFSLNLLRLFLKKGIYSFKMPPSVGNFLPSQGTKYFHH